MFCTSGGNSASVMSMRFVFNFIFFFLSLYIFFCPDRLPSLSLRPPPPPPLPSLPLLPLLPVFVSPLPPLLFPQSLCSSYGPEQGISFHFDKSFLFEHCDLKGVEPSPGVGQKQGEPGTAIGAERPQLKGKVRASKLGRSFFAAVSLLIRGDRERVKMQEPIA